MAAMDAIDILETTCAPLWIFFNLLVSTGLTWATTGKDVSIERCPKVLIRRQSCLTESCVQRAVLEGVMEGRRLSESKKKKTLTLKGSTFQWITIHACAVCNATRSPRLHIHRCKLLGLILLRVASLTGKLLLLRQITAVLSHFCHEKTSLYTPIYALGKPCI